MMDLNQAIFIAAEAHLHDYDKGGMSYFLHPMRMAMRLRTTDQERMQIAILHDVVEDHGEDPYVPASVIPIFDEVVKLITEANGGEVFPGVKKKVMVGELPYITYAGYILFHASARVAKALDCLTRREGETYEEFGDRVCKNYDAVLVKMEDVDDNSRVTRLKDVREKDFQRVQKYHRLWLRLQEAKRNFERELPK